MNSIWSFFDRIYCINLITRNDRYITSKKLFSDLGIDVVYYQPKKHPNGGLQGCFESHINIIKQAYKSGYNNIFIFEDDVSLKSTLTATNVLTSITKAVNFMKTNEWNLFYLGPGHDIRYYTTKPSTVPGIFEVNSMYTHAYAINRHMMAKLVNLKFTGIPYDYLLIHTPKAYALYPAPFYQGMSAGDINTGNCWYCGYPWLVELYFNFIQWYAYHINIPLSKVAYTTLALCLIYIILIRKNPVIIILILLTILIGLLFFRK